MVAAVVVVAAAAVGSGDGGPDSAAMTVAKDGHEGAVDNARQGHCGPTASGVIRPGDGGGGEADVVEVDLCSIDDGGSASDGGGLRAPSGCGGQRRRRQRFWGCR